MSNCLWLKSPWPILVLFQSFVTPRSRDDEVYVDVSLHCLLRVLTCTWSDKLLYHYVTADPTWMKLSV